MSREWDKKLRFQLGNNKDVEAVIDYEQNVREREAAPKPKKRVRFRSPLEEYEEVRRQEEQAGSDMDIDLDNEDDKREYGFEGYNEENQFEYDNRGYNFEYDYRGNEFEEIRGDFDHMNREPPIHEDQILDGLDDSDDSDDEDYYPEDSDSSSSSDDETNERIARLESELQKMKESQNSFQELLSGYQRTLATTNHYLRLSMDIVDSQNEILKNRPKRDKSSKEERKKKRGLDKQLRDFTSIARDIPMFRNAPTSGRRSRTPSGSETPSTDEAPASTPSDTFSRSETPMMDESPESPESPDFMYKMAPIVVPVVKKVPSITINLSKTMKAYNKTMNSSDTPDADDEPMPEAPLTCSLIISDPVNDPIPEALQGSVISPAIESSSNSALPVIEEVSVITIASPLTEDERPTISNMTSPIDEGSLIYEASSTKEDSQVIEMSPEAALFMESPRIADETLTETSDITETPSEAPAASEAPVLMESPPTIGDIPVPETGEVSEAPPIVKPLPITRDSSSTVTSTITGDPPVTEKPKSSEATSTAMASYKRTNVYPNLRTHAAPFRHRHHPYGFEGPPHQYPSNWMGASNWMNYWNAEPSASYPPYWMESNPNEWMEPDPNEWMESNPNQWGQPPPPPPPPPGPSTLSPVTQATWLLPRYKTLCIFCDSLDHKSEDCSIHATWRARRKCLRDKNICWKCLQHNNFPETNWHFPCPRHRFDCPKCSIDKSLDAKYYKHHPLLCSKQ